MWAAVRAFCEEGYLANSCNNFSNPASSAVSAFARLLRAGSLEALVPHCLIVGKSAVNIQPSLKTSRSTLMMYALSSDSI